jgi:hypothetical protein
MEHPMDYTEALSFSFKDEEWHKKLLIGGLFLFAGMFAALLFITGFLVMGYYVGVLRNVLHGEEKPLPSWTSWSKIIVDGILGGIIFLIYFVFIGGLAALVIVGVVEEPGMEEVERVMVIIATSLLALLGLMILTNLGLVRFAATNDFGAAFGFAEIFRLLKNDFGDYLSLSIFSFILNAVLFLAGLGIFSPFTNFWGLVVQAHLFGQCARGSHEPESALPSASSIGMSH